MVLPAGSDSSSARGGSDRVNILDALLGEHGLFYAWIDELEDWLGDDGVSSAEVRSAARMLARGLTSHAAIEDELLFPALEAHIGPAGPLACMRSEHDELHHALAAARAPATDDPVAVMRDVLALTREHFAKEERVLFPMARQMIPDAELVELGRGWSRRRTVPVEETGRTAV